MAGRGTDIVLGGNPSGLVGEFLKGKQEPSEEDLKDALQKAEELCRRYREWMVQAGGHHINDTERHEARRIDNQLRGRSGRQGDPGSSRFYLSLEDDLMRIFGSDRISGLMGKLGMEEDVPIENRMVSKAIENAQKKVEAHNFEIRKHLLEYDDVMNKQRTEIYAFRREILEADSLRDRVDEMLEDVVTDLVMLHCPEDRHAEYWEMDELKSSIFGLFGIKPQRIDGIQGVDALREELINEIKEFYNEKEKEAGSEVMRYLEKIVMLQVVDAQWKDHLLAMDHLKEGIGLRGYGQKDPLVEYKREAFEVFAEMTERIKREILTRLFRIQVRTEEEAEKLSERRRTPLILNRGSGTETSKPVKKVKKVGRNEPCPCGSGKKYKKCCGLNA
ncbi:MAG: hypothetical protein D6726_09170 [Nitrospirae bacterium]|nr:MAG: hypothetical protein D6726_09170 [Nitrospirota bacterium]